MLGESASAPALVSNPQRNGQPPGPAKRSRAKDGAQASDRSQASGSQASGSEARQQLPNQEGAPAEVEEECIEVGEEEQGASQFKKGSTSTPGPGEYIWNDDANLRKKPVWSMTSPDRRNLDLMLGTWTPASMTLQPRAPDPGEYGGLDRKCGKNGNFFAPMFAWERQPHRPCMAPEPRGQAETDVNIPMSIGAKHPSKKMTSSWSMTTKDRAQLPGNITSWTPTPNTEQRPGPGAYNVHTNNLLTMSKTSRWKATTRRGCTWGGRGANLHPDERSWVPKTFGSRLGGGEVSRIRVHPNKGSPKHRCGCVICPGPGCCDSSDALI